MQKQTHFFFHSALLEKIITSVWIGLMVLGILSNPLYSYPGRDGGIFLYIGSLILKGKMPYLDVWENKGPLVFYINALGLFLTNGSRWGVWLLEFLFLFCAGYIGFALVKRMMGVLPALIGTFVWIVTAGKVFQGGNFSEEYSLLFSFMTVLFYIKNIEKPSSKFYCMLIGMSLGANILLRPNNVGMQVAVVGTYFVLAVISRDWRLLVQRVVLVVVGAILIITPVVFYFSLKNVLSEMINVVLIFNIQYSEGGGLSRVLDGLTSAFSSIGLAFTLPTLAGYFLSLYSFFKANKLETLLSKFLLIFIIGWPVEVFLSSLSGRNYPHYFLGWAPYFGIFSAYLAYVVLCRLRPHFDQYIIVYWSFFFVIALFGKINIWKGYGAILAKEWPSPHSRLEYIDPIASYIRENTAPEDKVFIWGFRPVINFASDRESPVSFLPYPLIHVDTPLGEHWADQFYSQFTTHPPTLIINMIELADRERIPDIDPEVRKQNKIKWKDVVLAYNYKDILDFIYQNYSRVDTVDGSDIYRLNTTIP